MGGGGGEDPKSESRVMIVLGLEGGGDSVKVVQVKIEAKGPLFDLEEVPPVVTPAQVVPFRDLRFDSKVGSDGEFINGDV